jgi:cytochrome c2
VSKKSAPEAKSPVLTPEAIEIGDARKGLNCACKVCAACHNVQRSDVERSRMLSGNQAP